ncbi:MAG: NUDIX hydrolase [Patescibacteria group bacterium]|nr:NUDIX hydrolase [Patescibacteria group bacterium]
MEKGIIVHSLIINQGKILILKRAKQEDPLKNHWDFPGGTLEDGEQPILGAKREIREETGLVVKDLQLFYCVSNIDAKKKKQFITLIFLGKTKANPKKIKLSKREHGEFKWIELDEFQNYQVVDFVKGCVSYLKSHDYAI